MSDLNLHATEDRIKDIPLDVFYGVDSSPKAQIDFIAHFVIGDDGRYLPHKEAVKAVLDGRTVGDLEAITQDLVEKMELGAVPKK